MIAPPIANAIAPPIAFANPSANRPRIANGSPSRPDPSRPVPYPEYLWFCF